MGEVARQGTNKLGTLAERINAEHRACKAASSAALEHAMNAGVLLLEAKAGCPYGTWQDWVADNFEGSLRTAQIYMHLASRRAEIGEAKAQSSALSSIAGALHLLSFKSVGPVPRPEERQDAAEPLPLWERSPDVWREYQEHLARSYVREHAETQARKGDPTPPPGMDTEVPDEQWRKAYARVEEERIWNGGRLLRDVIKALNEALGPLYAIRPEEAGKALAQREGPLAHMEGSERALADLRVGVAWLQRTLEEAEQARGREEG